MLQEYKRKRNFKITPEPAGADEPTAKQKSNANSLTFVIQKHAVRRLHYDPLGSGRGDGLMGSPKDHL